MSHSQAESGCEASPLGLGEWTVRGKGPNRVLIPRGEQKVPVALITTGVGSNLLKGLVALTHFKFPRLYSPSMPVHSFIHPFTIC